MAKLVQQSTSSDPLFFFLVESADHITALTGATPTVTISKNGGSFATPTGTVSEIANGWYQVAGNSTDTNTLGDILLHATASSGDPCDMVVAQVVAFNPRNSNLGLSQVSANVTEINGVSTSSVTTVNANIGETQPINFTGSGSGALVKSDMQDIAGSAVSTSSAQLGVNVVNIAGHAATLDGNNLLEVDVADIAGNAVSTSSAQIGVNVVNIAGQAAALDGNNLLKVDVEDINGNATAAQQVSKANQAIGRGTCASGGSTTSVTTSAWNLGSSGVASGQFIGRTIIFDANTSTQSLQGQATNITANTSGSNPTFTVSTLTTAPSSGDTFSVL